MVEIIWGEKMVEIIYVGSLDNVSDEIHNKMFAHAHGFAAGIAENGGKYGSKIFVDVGAFTTTPWPQKQVRMATYDAANKMLYLMGANELIEGLSFPEMSKESMFDLQGSLNARGEYASFGLLDDLLTAHLQQSV